MFVISVENRNPGVIEYFIIDDESLLRINAEFLEHHYYTDVIAFDYSVGNVINGEIYISSNTVRTNAQLFKRSYTEELRRVMIHGLLHLLGYSDKSKIDKDLMTNKEDYYLEKYRSKF